MNCHKFLFCCLSVLAISGGEALYLIPHGLIPMPPHASPYPGGMPLYFLAEPYIGLQALIQHSSSAKLNSGRPSINKALDTVNKVTEQCILDTNA